MRPGGRRSSADDDVAAYRRQLEQLDAHWRGAHEHKSAAFLRVSSLWSPIDLKRAMEALGAGTRAAFTYGYHKDVTVNAAIEALSIEARDLGTELARTAAELCVALGVVDAVTDHDHVMDNAASLVAAVATADVPLAACVASALKARLSKYMWRTSIAEAVAAEGLDVQAIREQFHQFAPGLPFGYEEPDDAAPTKPLFADLLQAVSDRTPKAIDDRIGDRERLEHRLIAAASTTAELEEATTVLLQMKPQDQELFARLAQRASELNEAALAFEHAERSVTAAAEPFMYAYWHGGATRALALMCRLNPAKARPRFNEVVQEAVLGEYGIGFASVPILCECLRGLGDKASAKEVLIALLEHLKEITAVYPREEPASRKLLQSADFESRSPEPT